MANARNGAARPDRPAEGIGFILLGMTVITMHDAAIKALSDSYPLHQLVLIRSVIGIALTLALLAAAGGLARLRTSRPGLHLLRGLLMVAANMCLFAGLAAMPLAEATALFFVAPLLITLLSMPLLGERVGPRRLAAVAAGFVGVLIMVRPWQGGDGREVGLAVALLPVLGAAAYALFQILTRRLGAETGGTVLAAHVQAVFIVVSLLFCLAVGDGRFAPADGNPSLTFLLRAWVWPDPGDWPLLAALGAMAGVIGVTLSHAYRLADAAAVAPFEYVALPLAVLWGWLVFGELPDPGAALGMALIAASGLFVFLREGRRGRPVASGRRVNRRY